MQIVTLRHSRVILKPAHNSAQLRCLENGNDDFGVEAFWIGDAARVGYFVPLNGSLNGHPPSTTTRRRHGKMLVRQWEQLRIE